MADIEFTAGSTKQIRYTVNEDNSIAVEHVDVGRNPAPPELLYVIPSSSVDDLKSFFDLL